MKGVLTVSSAHVRSHPQAPTGPFSHASSEDVCESNDFRREREFMHDHVCKDGTRMALREAHSPL